MGDFGLAKLIDFPYSKSMSVVAGSYGYIAPGKGIVKQSYLFFSFIACEIS